MKPIGKKVAPTGVFRAERAVSKYFNYVQEEVTKFFFSITRESPDIVLLWDMRLNSDIQVAAIIGGHQHRS
jgi:hypothetical protein